MASTPLVTSQACNPVLIKQLREQRGWSQAELAQRAGYSERLIRKAESGRPISPATITDLAETFSCVGGTIYPEDLTTHPVHLAEAYLAAFYTKGAGWVDAISHFIDPEIVMRIAGNPSHIPFAGEHRGIEAVRRAAGVFFSILQVPDGHDHTLHYRFLGQGNEVNMTGESWIHPIGRPLQEPIQVWHRFVFRRGKLVLIEDLFDTLEGHRVLSHGDPV